MRRLLMAWIEGPLKSGPASRKSSLILGEGTEFLLMAAPERACYRNERRNSTIASLISSDRDGA
jgi:hypothetical protein